MKKTPLQQLIEEISGMKALLNNQDTLVAKSMDVIKNRATELLKKERVVIVDAYYAGMNEEEIDNGEAGIKISKEYFNETFEQ